jgi:hypothetical protein
MDPELPKIGNCKLKKAADLIGIPYQSLYTAVTRGDVPHTKIGRSVLIPWGWIRQQVFVEVDGEFQPLS